jgi:hypothetical protein
METLELMLIAPITYLVFKGFIKLWNSSVEQAYKEAELTASILLGSGQKVEANLVMERALIDYKRSIIRKVLGVKI